MRTTATCAALDCTTAVPEGFPMCAAHWPLVPLALRPPLLVGRRGLGPPTPDELDARRRAVAAVARREGLPYRTVSPRTGEPISSGVDAVALALELFPGRGDG